MTNSGEALVLRNLSEGIETSKEELGASTGCFLYNFAVGVK